MVSDLTLLEVELVPNEHVACKAHPHMRPADRSKLVCRSLALCLWLADKPVHPSLPPLHPLSISLFFGEYWPQRWSFGIDFRWTVGGQGRWAFKSWAKEILNADRYHREVDSGSHQGEKGYVLPPMSKDLAELNNVRGMRFALVIDDTT